MKKYLITPAIAVLLSLVLITCKKDVEIVGTNSNKIEIGAIIIDSLSYFSAKVNTSISNIGNNKVSQHGHCWNKSTNPTIENNKTQLGAITQAADYVSELLNLEDQTKYYIRSYVISGNVIIYGSETTITTLKTGKPSLTTNEVTEIDNFSAICGGIITTDSGLIINSKGLCWDTTSTFSIEDCLGIVLINSGIGSFYGNITELSKGKQYYVKAFATNQKGTSYGEEKSFVTTDISLPIVTTTHASQITSNSAAAGGNVTNDGNLTVTQRGVCWHTNPNPTMENNLGNTTDGSGTGSFVSNINGLTEGQTYYYRAYATNLQGTGYGIIKEFTTTNLELPTVSTNNITNIGITYATGGGNVTNDGNSSVTARGVCWNTSGNPTMQNNLGHTTNGSGTGTFTSSLTGLNANTTYYVAAYATNGEGTSYGSQYSFITHQQCGEILNYGGKTYSTVLIGSKCWMAENLNIGNRINGSQEMTNNSVKEKYCYDDNEANCEEYGGLYQWNEMMQYTTQEGAKGICPDGWHIPSDNEWKVMEMALGMSQSEADKTGWRGTIEGDEMKSTSGWYNNGNGTNSSGFNALPGGYRYSNGTFYYLSYYGIFWSSTWKSYTNSRLRDLRSYYDQVGRDDNFNTHGYSVRCIKN